MLKPTLGSIVHYVMPDCSCRSAIVVRNWADDDMYIEEMGVNLQVFVDGPRDMASTENNYVPGVPYSERNPKDPQPMTWHWPVAKVES